MLQLLRELLTVTRLTVRHLYLAGLIRGFVIRVGASTLLVPVRTPGIRLVDPLHVAGYRVNRESDLTIPFHHPELINAPTNVNGSVERALPTVVLRRISFSVQQPIRTTARGPSNEPKSTDHEGLYPCLCPTVRGLLLLYHVRQDENVGGLLSILEPSTAILPRAKVSTDLLLLANRSCRVTVLTVNVNFLVPLHLIITLRSLLMIPRLKVRGSVNVRLVTPCRFPIILDRRNE